MIDLHLHSTASDGILAPAELVRRAREGGLAAIALTDHDTLEGVPEALAAGAAEGIEVVPGVEISLDHEPGTFHLIGLLVDPEDGPLREALGRIRTGREDRNARLLRRLAELECPLDPEEVRAFAGGGIVARPHFAQAMVARGYVSRYQEAFDRYLGKGAAAYADRFRISVEEAIRLVHDAGGVAVLCHPRTLGLDPPALDRFVRELSAAGIDAIEVVSGDPDPVEEALYRDVARAAGILVSGGSDFHGYSKRDQRVGLARGALDLPYGILEDLRRRRVTTG